MRLSRHAIPLQAREVIRSMPCAACGCPPPSQVDHIIPVARGGDHGPRNLQPLCSRCNHVKGDMVMSVDRLKWLVQERCRLMAMTGPERRREKRRRRWELYGYGRPPKEVAG